MLWQNFPLGDFASKQFFMDEEIKKLLQKNLELNQRIYEMVKSIKSYIFWQRIFGVLKILIIVIPIIVGIIYLPPLFKQVINQYQSLLGVGQNNLNLESLLGGEGLNVNSLLEDYRAGKLK